MAGCVDVGLFDALGIWWGGAKLDSYCLNGISTISIGRFAKVLALIASTTILLDLLGEERIHTVTGRFGDWLRRVAKRTIEGPIPEGEEMSAFIARISPLTNILITAYVLIVVTGLSLFPFLWVWDSVEEIYRAARGLPNPVTERSLFFWVLGWYMTFAAVLAGLPAAIGGILLLAARVFGNTVLCWYARLLAGLLLLTSWLLDMVASS